MSNLAKKYHKIPNLYRPECQSIFMLDEVVVSEKIDGTNFSFGLVAGEPRMNSRNNQVWGIKKGINQTFYNADFDGFGFVQAFKDQFGLELFDKILQCGFDNVLVFGEFYGQGIMNRVNYGAEKKFAFFDAYDLEEEKWFNLFEFKAFAREYSLPIAPILYTGPPKLSVFEKLLSQDSKLGVDNGVATTPNLQEGIVIKGLNNETNKWEERIIAKFKQEKFKEIKGSKIIKTKKASAEENSLLKFAEDIAEKYLTESRLENCLEKLRGENVPIQITAMPKVISYLSNDVLSDLEEEEKSDPSFNERYYKKIVGKEISILFQQYLKKQFEERIR